MSSEVTRGLNRVLAIGGRPHSTLEAFIDHDRTTANLRDDITDAQEQRRWMFQTFLEE